jgi:hypothetical protein
MRVIYAAAVDFRERGLKMRDFYSRFRVFLR